ncbi:MAG: vanadium-dependent haloperoxidase [Rhodobacter sp.]|nr:vanadium-dependent haloperoxidase [Rhodobacter sp.]
MNIILRAASVCAVMLWGWAGAAQAALPPEQVLQNWYRLMLELVRHTPTYSPPVASRAFAYVGITGFEAVAGGSDDLQTLAGQINGLTALPARDAALAYDDGVVLQAALSTAVKTFFSNTGPTGQRAMAAMERVLTEKTAAGLPGDVTARSRALGVAVAQHVVSWSLTDGGAVVENMGFPYDYALGTAPGAWVPTSRIVQQQKPLLPKWGNNRTFAMPNGATCGLPPPPAYSVEPGSAFYAEAKEVYDTVKSLTAEQREIARFWSDDPMLSPTPPGHWISIALQVQNSTDAPLAEQVDLQARLGIALADAFIGCWHAKFEYDLLRPVTYIRATMDPKWEPLLNTPPFPEYPSGHSTQSGAAAEVLTDFFGEDFAFEDATHLDDGLAPRRFPSFWAAAQEAGMSRLYGGIHFRSAIDRGLEQGRCIGRYVTALQTRIR